VVGATNCNYSENNDLVENISFSSSPPKSEPEKVIFTHAKIMWKV
jgi:hypothetical protein